MELQPHRECITAAGVVVDLLSYMGWGWGVLKFCFILCGVDSIQNYTHENNWICKGKNKACHCSGFHRSSWSPTVGSTQGWHGLLSSVIVITDSADWALPHLAGLSRTKWKMEIVGQNLTWHEHESLSKNLFLSQSVKRLIPQLSMKSLLRRMTEQWFYLVVAVWMWAVIQRITQKTKSSNAGKTVTSIK